MPNKSYNVILDQSYNDTIFIRQDTSGKVYHLDYNNQEHLVFDFGLALGDTIAFDKS